MSSNYPNGFAGGVTIRGIPLLQTHPGEVFWVNNSTVLPKGGVGGSNGNDGSYLRPFSTVDYAIGRCTASRGDIIVVMPGYTETISAAAGWACDVAGVAIIGLGTGTNKPTITFSDTASDINISAANVLISNIRCVSSVNSLVNFIDVDEGYATIHNCDFITGSATEAVAFIDQATIYDGLTVSGCKFLQPTDPEATGGGAGTGGIYLVDSEDILVENCTFRGQFESGIIHNKTTAAKGLVVRNCELSNELTVPFLLVTTAEGVCDGCYGATLGASDASEAQVYGTIGTLFWISQSTSLGNDSGAGGQGSVTGTVAS
jgi:hypothetical protein